MYFATKGEFSETESEERREICGRATFRHSSAYSFLCHSRVSRERHDTSEQEGEVGVGERIGVGLRSLRGTKVRSERRKATS